MNKNIVVTGAAGALGKVVCATLAEAGYKVIGVDLADMSPETVSLAVSGVDLTDEASVGRAFTAIGENVESLHGLVNIAGAFRWETIADGSPGTWDLLYRVNVRTALLATLAAIPLLKKAGGSIVNVGAAASVKAGVGMGAYAASKSGVARLTESLAEEMKDAGVRVNAVLPSIIDTVANRSDMPDADVDRWVAPQALAGVIAFLLSDAAAPITGALLPVTGRV